MPKPSKITEKEIQEAQSLYDELIERRRVENEKRQARMAFYKEQLAKMTPWVVGSSGSMRRARTVSHD